MFCPHEEVKGDCILYVRSTTVKRERRYHFKTKYPRKQYRESRQIRHVIAIHSSRPVRDDVVEPRLVLHAAVLPRRPVVDDRRLELLLEGALDLGYLSLMPLFLSL